MIKPLSGLDATFLYAETPNTPMNVIGTVIVEGEVDHAALIARFEERLPALTPFRRRLVDMPLGLDHPGWIEDPDFDVREHVTRMRVGAPGDARALEQAVARIARRHLDRSRPLWELVVLDGLEDDRTALVVKAHHAAVDGVAGAALLLHLFDRPGGDGAAESLPQAEPEPGSSELVQHGLSRLWERPGRVAGSLGQAGRSAGNLLKSWLAPDPAVRQAALPFQAPPSPFNGTLSPRRSVAYARVPLETLRRVRGAFGGTVNDVVLAACTRALQGELAERGALPERPLLAAVPVSTRTLADAADCGNRLSVFFAELPVRLEDPLHQLAEVRRSARRAKRFHAALGHQTLAALAELATPGLMQGALGLYGRWQLASLHRPPFNVLISNVQGPPMALELLGRPVHALRPHGPLMEGTGLNITLLSYAGSLDIGVLACQERVPEANRLADRIAEALEELAKLADAALPQLPPLAREVA